MTARTEFQSIEIDAEPETIFAFLADPRHIPNWAPGFADVINGDVQRGWQAAKNDRVFELRVIAARPSLTVDYLRQVAPGREGGAAIAPEPVRGGGADSVIDGN